MFAWGLQYKISLYYPPHSIHHQIAVAKLLSKNEQAAPTEDSLLASPKAQSVIVGAELGSLAFFVWVLRIVSCSAVTRSGRELKRPWRACARTCLSAFFFRPPPILA